MKIDLSKKILIGFFCLATVLRFYQLGSNPVSLNWDEASQGYNAYSILRTGADEYGNAWPFSIRSFDDYKPPLNTYLMVPTIAFFGLNAFAVRLPSAVFGLIAVGLIYVLTREIFWKHKKRDWIALASSAVLALSPWHLQFSRGAFEANIALTTYLGTITFYLLWLRSKAKYKVLFLLGSAISAGATLYAYHSARLVLPLMLLVLGAISYKRIIKDWKQMLPALMLGAIIATPFIYITFFRSASLARFNTVSYLANRGEFSSEAERFMRNAEFFNKAGINKIFHHRYLVTGSIFLRNYLDQFNLDFLVLEADGNGRHHAYGMGLFYLVELPLLLYGVYLLAKSKAIQYKSIIIFLVLLGPIPAALTDSTPHAIRSLMMLPGLVILVALGGVGYLSYVSNQKTIQKNIWYLSSCLIALISIFYYLNSYYVVSPYYQSKDWQYGYQELVEKLEVLEVEYDQIIVTTEYDQPHIFFAFYNKIEPRRYQEFAETASKGFDQYIFKKIDGSDFERENTLVVVHPDSTPDSANIIDTLEFKDGKVAFNLVSGI